ncbi:MAG: NAD(P)H-dependent glycerol-3-phosphate dehydrogenase [Elusimicrobiota bacterium]
MAKKKNRFNITVLGAGSWGITLADLLYNNGNSITLWEFDRRQAEKLKKKRSFISLKNYSIPDKIKITDSLEEAVSGSDCLVVSLPTVAVKHVASRLSKLGIRQGMPVISTVKGIEGITLETPSRILRHYLGNKVHIAVLSGPSHAEEVIKKEPTAVVIASVNPKTTMELQSIFSSIYFRVYTSSDLRGVELGGALKNVIAIASGICSGLGLGDNTRAALITRGNAEIMRLGIKLGAKKVTFSGLSGIGDLIVTCFSEHSRNFRFGKYLGSGYTVQEARDKVMTTVEGINTSKSCYRLSKRYNVQMPVCNIVYQMLFRGKEPSVALKELMLRPLKSENIL